jgi:hypothetical protein
LAFHFIRASIQALRWEEDFHPDNSGNIVKELRVI